MKIEKIDGQKILLKTSKSSDDGKYIFYILDGNKKIVTKYVGVNYLAVDLRDLCGKKLTFQCYYYVEGSKVKEQIDNFYYKNIPYVRGYVTYNYLLLKNNGYQSVDKKTSIDIDNISWVLTKDHNFNFNVHSLRFLSDFWGEYLKTYNLKYIFEAISIFKDFWCFINKNKINNFKTYDMALGIRSLHIYFLYQFVDVLDSSSRKFLEEVYDFHFNELSFGKGISKNNHGIWQLYGLRMLLLLKGDNNVEILKYCNIELKKLFDFSFNEEYIHVENSPFYHYYVVNLFSILPEILFDLKGLDKIVLNKKGFLYWFTDKNGCFYQIGDSHSQVNKVPFHSNFVNEFVNINGDFRSIFYKKSGYFVCKDKLEDNSLFVSCTSDTLIHKHVDNLSFTLWHQGKELISDGGVYSYNYSEIRDYCVSDKAHNVLSLKNRVFNINDIVLEDSGFLDLKLVDDKYVLMGKSSFKDFAYYREIIYNPLNKISIKDSIIKKGSDDKPTFNLNFSDKVELIYYNGKFLVQIDGRIFAIISSVDPFETYEIFKGNTNPLRGWVSKRYNEIKEAFSLELVFSDDTSEVQIDIIFK